MQILHVSFFLDVRICMLVPSKIEPSDLSVSSTVKSAKTCADLRVSSISIFRGPTPIESKRQTNARERRCSHRGGSRD